MWLPNQDMVIGSEEVFRSQGVPSTEWYLKDLNILYDQGSVPRNVTTNFAVQIHEYQHYKTISLYVQIHDFNNTSRSNSDTSVVQNWACFGESDFLCKPFSDYFQLNDFEDLIREISSHLSPGFRLQSNGAHNVTTPATNHPAYVSEKPTQPAPTQPQAPTKQPAPVREKLKDTKQPTKPTSSTKTAPQQVGIKITVQHQAKTTQPAVVPQPESVKTAVASAKNSVKSSSEEPDMSWLKGTNAAVSKKVCF